MSKTSKAAQDKLFSGPHKRQVQLRLLSYTAVSVPIVVGAFVAGIVFERQRVQTSSLETLPPIASKRGPGTAFKEEQDPAPYQTGTVSKEQQDLAPQGKQAARQEKITEAMWAIEAAWRAAIDAEHLLAVKIGTCYGARFIRRGADVRADLAKIDGVAVVGVVRITGMSAANQPAGKDSCFASISQALGANRRSFEGLEHVEAKFTYRIINSEIRLDWVDSEPAWLAIAITDNVRLGLGSWRAVSMQPLVAD